MVRPVAPTREHARRRPARRLPASRRTAVVVAAAAGLAFVGAGWLGGAGGLNGSPVNGLPAASASRAPGVAARSDPPAASLAPNGSGPPSTTPGSSEPPRTPSPTELRAALEVRLQATLDRVRPKLGIPGISATVIFPDGTAWSGATGLADVVGKTPVTAETPFAYASMSKTFTSAVVLQLIAEGRLRLSDRAAALLPPGLPFVVDRRITIGMLLDHTSGLADYFLNRKIDAVLQRAPTRTWTAADALRFVGKALSPPGKAWHYSNTNYLLLGIIAERIGGKPLATQVRERLLDPVGLASTWYQAVEDPRGALAHGYRFSGTKLTARPIDLADGTGIAPFRSVVTAAAGAGSLAGTSGDLARWARALYRGDVLGPTGTGLLLSDFNRTTGYLPGVAYGYGVQALSIDGHPSLGHSGRLLGFRGAVRHFPVDGLTIAVLTNQSRADPGAVVRALLKVVAPPPPKPFPSGSPTASGSPAGSGSGKPAAPSPSAASAG